MTACRSSDRTSVLMTTNERYPHSSIEPAILGRTVRTLLVGDISQAADAAGMRVKCDATGELDGFYLPARRRLERPRLVISSRASVGEREQLIGCALGHLYLGHTASRVYLYGPGCLDDLEHREATAFAQAFLAAGPGVQSRLIDFGFEVERRLRRA